VVDGAVDALDEDNMDAQAKALAEKLLRRLNDETLPDAKRKALAAMQRRGYAYGEANRALNAALVEMDVDARD
jgi:SOS response regulatory protein OraA/RecX